MTFDFREERIDLRCFYGDIFAILREGDAVRAALNQGDAQFFLYKLDTLADGWLCEVQAFSSFRDVLAGIERFY